MFCRFFYHRKIYKITLPGCKKMRILPSKMKKSKHKQFNFCVLRCIIKVIHSRCYQITWSVHYFTVQSVVLIIFLKVEYCFQWCMLISASNSSKSQTMQCSNSSKSPVATKGWWYRYIMYAYLNQIQVIEWSAQKKRLILYPHRVVL